ncbi:protein ABHD11-like isoform X2 [Uloborus diversus]|uniref:protein ABHD11-like isoform X2 n=1 Tax=Uloborus diversus TaxID=327109 RepID=UPI00240A1365|nr:protein ABHD11-like isoform X2 [Uloborus diversus]
MGKLENIISIFCAAFGLVYLAAVEERSPIKLAFDVYSPPTEEGINFPPIILVHGLFDSKESWKHIAPVIANETGRKIYAIDLRNHGESPWVEEINFDVIADDLEGFVNQHNISKSVLIGHSMGGKGALTFALRKPEKVEKLLIEDIPVSNITFIPQGLARLLLRLLRKSLQVIPPGTEQREAQNIFTEFIKGKLPDEIVPCQMKYFDLLPIKLSEGKYSWKTNIDAIERNIMSGNGITTFGQDLSSYEPYPGDALFIYGTKSVFNVEKDELILKYFPRSTKLGFVGATHLIHQEYEEDFSREAIHFTNGRFKPKKTKCEED